MNEIHPADLPYTIQSASRPLLVDYYSPGCPPCHQTGIALKEIEPEFRERVDFVKVNVAADDYRVATQFEVSAVPTLAMIADGNELERLVGKMTITTIRNFIEKHVP